VLPGLTHNDGITSKTDEHEKCVKVGINRVWLLCHPVFLKVWLNCAAGLRWSECSLCRHDDHVDHRDRVPISLHCSVYTTQRICGLLARCSCRRSCRCELCFLVSRYAGERTCDGKHQPMTRDMTRCDVGSDLTIVCDNVGATSLLAGCNPMTGSTRMRWSHVLLFTACAYLSAIRAFPVVAPRIRTNCRRMWRLLSRCLD